MSKDEEPISREQIFAQLAYIKGRLETFPIHEIQAVCLRDCMLLLIRTFAGEEIPEVQLANIGGGVMEGSVEQGHAETIGGVLRRGGEEIAPGVVQYPPASNAATVDVEAGSNATSRAPTPSDMPKPAAGSLMAMALQNEGKSVETTEHSPAPAIPQGIPSPSQTAVEITDPGTGQAS